MLTVASQGGSEITRSSEEAVTARLTAKMSEDEVDLIGESTTRSVEQRVMLVVLVKDSDDDGLAEYCDDGVDVARSELGPLAVVKI